MKLLQRLHIYQYFQMRLSPSRKTHGTLTILTQVKKLLTWLKYICVCGGITVKPQAPGTADDATPSSCALLRYHFSPMSSQHLGESSDAVQPLLHVWSTTDGRLSKALARCHPGKAQVSREQYSPAFLPCGACTGLYTTAHGSTEEEATEADA